MSGIRTAMACSALALGWTAASAAAAQEAAAPEPAAEQAAEQSEEPVVTVTGSRLIRGDYSSISPIVTVTAETLQDSGAAGTVGPALSQLPQFTPTAGPGTAFPNRLGQSLLNLRGLGPERFLTLLNDRRVQPATAEGFVDLNFIPSNLVRSVETITGGASATYGSDAVTGVVNFRLRTDVDGLELYAQYNQPELGGGDSENVNVIWGRHFNGDKSSVLLSVDYSRVGDAIFAGERPFYSISRTNGVLPNATVTFGATPPSQAVVNSVFGAYGAPAGSVSNARPIGVNYDGTLFTQAPLTSPVFNYRGPLDEESVVITGNQVISSAGREYALTVPLDRYNVFGRVEHELPGGVTLFSELFYTSSTAEVPIGYGGLGLAGLNGTVPVTNPFIPDDLRSLLASRSNPNAPFSVTYSFRNLPRIVFETEGEVGQIVAGASGEFGAGWTWDVYATYGRTTTDQAISGFSLAAAQQLLGAPDGGASLCAGGLDIFGPPASISQECGDFIARTGVTENEFDQSVGEASVQGTLFNLPAGALEVALGASWRRNTYSANTSDILQAGDLVPQGRALPASGSQSVTEGFVEVLAPLLRDLPLVHKLNLNAGYRHSEYRTFGGADTYNASLDWEVTDSFRFRGGYARAIRAPSLADLFTPESLVSVTLGTPSASNRNGDPCDIRSSFRTGAAAAQVRALCLEQGVPESIIDSFTYPNSNVFPTARGNPDLAPEQADTVTFGLVWRSPFDNEWLDRVQVAVDYYNIKVDDAIGVLPFNTALTNCFNGDNVSNPGYAADNLFCSFVVRNDLGQISSASETPRINQASYQTSGLDIQVDWAVGLNAIGFGDGAGELQLNFLGSWLEEFMVQSFQTARKLDFAGASNGSIVPNVLPQWKSVTRLTYSNDLFDIGVRWRHLDGVQDVSRVTTTGSTTPGVESVDYYDLNGAWRVSDGAEIRAGVTNLLDRDIPQVGTVPGNTDPATYDVIGRTFYLGVGVKF